MNPRYSSPLSLKVWNNAAVGVNGQSPTIDIGNCPFVSIFGNSSAATTISVMYSQEGVAWYAGPTKALAGAGNFEFDVTTGAQFLALQSSAAATITAIISAK